MSIRVTPKKLAQPEPPTPLLFMKMKINLPKYSCVGRMRHFLFEKMEGMGYFSNKGTEGIEEIHYCL